MGYYIETPGQTKGKADYIIKKYGTKKLAQAPTSVAEVGEGQAVICVTSNGLFDAAAFCYDDSELKAFTLPHDPRPKTWLHMDWSKAVELSGLKVIK
jgi:hypothetical protein